jgi:hypothetical protein
VKYKPPSPQPTMCRTSAKCNTSSPQAVHIPSHNHDIISVLSVIVIAIVVAISPPIPLTHSEISTLLFS